jgi:hypothetical protein
MQTDQDNAHFKLPPVLDLSAAEEFLGTLRQHLQGEGSLRLDASAVETLTLPCIQILVAAMRDHGQISIEQPSTEFADAFRDLGLSWPNGGVPDSPAQAIPEQLCEPDAEPDHSPEVQSSDDANDFNHEQKDACDMAKKILTIDDSKTIRDMLMLTLSDAGFDVLRPSTARTGSTFWATIASTSSSPISTCRGWMATK